VKYIYDIPSPLVSNFETDIIAKHKQIIPNSNWTGVFSKDHVPAKGEWE